MISPFQFLLQPVSVATFLENHYQRRALHVAGDSSKFEDLFDWDDLNAILNTSPHPHLGLKMSHAGKPFVPQDAIGLIRAVQDGATLIIEEVDRYNLTLGDFLSRLTAEVQEETRFNLYVSYPEHQGYRTHYDTQDFFILQIAGHKEWRVFPETVPLALFHQKTHGKTPPPDDSCYLRCTLSPGDLLYVPRGHWHYAVARHEASLHLTLAMFVKTGITFVKWLTDELTDYEAFRRTFPISVQTDCEPILTLHELRNELIEVLNEPNLYDRFLQFRAATSRNRQPFHFPQHTATSLGEWKGKSRLKRRIQTASISVGRVPGKVDLVCAGRRLMFDLTAEPLLRLIFSSTEVSQKDLIAAGDGMSWPIISAILLPLFREGFVALSAD